MSEEVVVRTSSGIGFGGLLTLLFIGLKLGGVIDWNWIWVLSPLWVPLAFVMAVIAVLFLAFVIAASLMWLLGRR